MQKINEKQTRKQYIDGKLCDAGWLHIIPYSKDLDLSSLHKTAVEELPTDNGPADYVLFLHGQPVAIVEAKKLSVGPQNVLEQGKRYARGIRGSIADFNGYKVPFIYSTNGEVVWFNDLRSKVTQSRKIKLFHTPPAVAEMITGGTKESNSWFANNPPNNERLRYYQKEAISSIEASIQENKRRMLVAMATGTGKTFTVASLIYRLLKSKSSKRVLFLVDRRALAAQAVMTFASYEAEPNQKFNQLYQVYSQKFQQDSDEEKFDFTALPERYLTDPDGNQVFVYVSTIQRMRINLFGKEGMFSQTGDFDPEDDADKLDIPIHAFDTIIADECHRGYTSSEDSKWREVLDHFDAIKIGLTATPASHTTSFFKNIVYRYDYEKAVQDGYLVDYDAVKISSQIRNEGLSVREGEAVYRVNTQTGAEVLDNLEDQVDFQPPDIERNITSPDSNRKIIQEFAKFAKEHEEKTGRFPKTLIFADNDLQHTSHADQVVQICREVFGRGDDFVKKITGAPNVDRPLQRIKEFRNRPEPHIVVTVDMLSTGVDVPAIECLIFMRPVRSRILFEQMLGRGTRLCEQFPNGLGTNAKTHFTVFDCFGGALLESFQNKTGITQVDPISPTRSIEQIIQEIHNNQDVDYNVRCLVKRLQRMDKHISAEGRDSFARFIPEGDIKGYAQQLSQNLEQNRLEAIKTLTDPDFIRLLKNYPRAPRTFLKAPDVEDVVTSEYVFRTTDGKELKIGDYIQAFEQFVRDNPDHIEAISIVVEKPASWNTQALKELRKSLKTRPERFTEDNLRKAYKYPLADIISMVKHAAKEEPLLSASERIDLAIEEVTKDMEIASAQEKWLELIRAHLVENLTIDKGDFDIMPIFTNRGASFSKVNQDFGNKLSVFISQLNSTIPKVFNHATN